MKKILKTMLIAGAVLSINMATAQNHTVATTGSGPIKKTDATHHPKKKTSKKSGKKMAADKSKPKVSAAGVDQMSARKAKAAGTNNKTSKKP